MQDLGIHRPGGVLADPSGAMGFLWSRRGLAFWYEVTTDRGRTPNPHPNPHPHPHPHPRPHPHPHLSTKPGPLETPSNLPAARLASSFSEISSMIACGQEGEGEGEG